MVESLQFGLLAMESIARDDIVETFNYIEFHFGIYMLYHKCEGYGTEIGMKALFNRI